MVKVTLRNLTKSYGKVIAVDDLTLEIPDKSLTVLLGPTGAGKTTTIKCISGVLSPDRGDILFDDESVLSLPPWERDVAQFFQTYALYPHMSVYDNIAYPLKQRGLSKNEIDRKVKEIARKLRIYHLLDRKDPTTLSGGEMQRVALARTLVREPKVFLLDEPISNLDAKLREEMIYEFKRLCRELQQTMIYATPDYLEALEVGEKIAVIRDGKLQQYGTPQEIYYHPVNKFVATFVGSPPINMLEGDLKTQNSSIVFQGGGVTIDISELAGKWLEKLKGDKIILAIRPEDIEISKEKLEGAFRAKALVAQPLGHETVVVCNLGENEIRILVKGFLSIRYGEEIWLKLNKQKIHIIDPNTEEVLL
ncbi:MAG: sugar ABC transporter ATP-binding protein [Thaumarchaeota archaeon]|nr:MAG: sugar ABC transporter ATP-binding protein [Nitrososphaerota archaeon]HDD40061.1 ABC transporter ATP-binding protein [Nitrososphaeria archaeon]